MKYLFLLGYIFFATELLGQTISPDERVFLHTPKDVFTWGDSIVFTATITSKNSNIKSRVVYVELLSTNAHLVTERILKVDSVVTASIKIDSTFQSNHYILRAYTHYLTAFGAKAFFQKEIYVSKDTTMFRPSKPKMEVAVEGGTMVVGLPSKLGISTGVANQTGQLLDSQNQIFAAFQTDSIGMVDIPIVPAENQNYHLLIHNSSNDIRRIDIEKAQAKGAVLGITQNDTLIKAKIYTRQLTSDSLILVITSSQQIVAVQRSPKNTIVLFNFSKKILPKGLLNFVLMTSDGKVINQRIWWNDDTFPALTSRRFNEIDSYLDALLSVTTLKNNELNKCLILRKLIEFKGPTYLEKELTLSRTGVAFDTKRQVLKKTSITVLASTKTFGVRTLETDSLGNFTVNNIEETGLIELKIQTFNGEPVGTKWLTREIPPLEMSQVLTNINTLNSGIDIPLIEGKELEEVVVKAKRTRDKEFADIRQNLGLTYRPEKIIENEQLIEYQDIKNVLQAYVPGLRFKSISNGKQVPVLREQILQIFVDGIKLDDVDLIPVGVNLTRIEVSKSLASSSLVGGPLIAVYTKQFNSRLSSKSFVGNTFVKGFDKCIE